MSATEDATFEFPCAGCPYGALRDRLDAYDVRALALYPVLTHPFVRRTGSADLAWGLYAGDLARREAREVWDRVVVIHEVVMTGDSTAASPRGEALPSGASRAAIPEETIHDADDPLE